MTDEERMKGVNRLRERLTDRDLETFTLRKDPPKPRASWLWRLNVCMCVAVVLIAVAQVAGAQDRPACMPRETMRQILDAEYGEVLRAVVLLHDGSRMETWANEASQTWTMTRTSAIGISCLFMGGVGVAILPPPDLPAEAL